MVAVCKSKEELEQEKKELIENCEALKSQVLQRGSEAFEERKVKLKRIHSGLDQVDVQLDAARHNHAKQVSKSRKMNKESSHIKVRVV